MAQRFFVHTFGCQMNVHDSQRMEEVLLDAGYSAGRGVGDADVIVINTCSIRDKAEQKLLSYLGRLRAFHDRGAKIVVAGCVAQQEGEALFKKSDLVDAVIGPDNLQSLPSILAQNPGPGPRDLSSWGRVRRRAGDRIAVTEFDLEAPSFLAARARAGESSAFVTTMKGCDENCTYCVVPNTRGQERYRSLSSIVEEVSSLVADGVREVTLLGQTVNSWFENEKPTRSRKAPSASNFAGLLDTIAKNVPDLVRLRYTSPHPRHVTDALIDAHKRIDMLAQHVHLPVQSGSDTQLRRMARRYTRQEYLDAAQRLKAARPHMTLSTDIIVGFPGETEEDFLATLSLVEEVGFAAAFCFKYSPRPNTPALKLGDDVTKAEKESRLERVLALVDAQQAKQLASLVGTRAQVLVEKAGGPDTKERSVSGRSERNEIVHIREAVGLKVGDVVEVEIAQAFSHSLRGIYQHTLSPAPSVHPNSAENSSTKNPSTKNPSTKNPSTKNPSTKNPSTKKLPVLRSAG